MSPHLVYMYFAAPCAGGNFFSFPKWYSYLPNGGSVDYGGGISTCNPQIRGINDIWLVLAAVIDIMLRIGSLLAVGFIIWGAIRYIMSQGEPDKLSQARTTIVNSLIGLVISVAATALVTFVAGRFK